MRPKILIVEDEQEMAAVIKDNLEYEGYQTLPAADGVEALQKCFEEQPDLIILDIMMPAKDGIQVCLELRSRSITIPIIFLTAKASEVDRVLGLEIGGDDYLCKPFSVRELLARVKALLRRCRTPKTGNLIHVGECTIDPERMLITHKDGTQEELSHYEVGILKLLLAAKNTPVSRNEILNRIWGLESYPSNRTVDNYIVKLRKKLEPDPHNPRYILTIHGVGYKLVM